MSNPSVVAGGCTTGWLVGYNGEVTAGSGQSRNDVRLGVVNLDVEKNLNPENGEQTGQAMPFRFADCVLDVASRTLVRRGEPVEIQAQVFDLLHYLARHPNTVVSKSTLLNEVWGNIHLTDTAITQAVRKVRQAVGDDGQRQHVIRTVHGQGFSFVASVERGPPAQRPASGGDPARHTPATLPIALKWLLAACLLLLVGVGIWQLASDRESAYPSNSIAVFPFANQTGNPDLDWLQRGLADTVGMLLEQSGTGVLRVLDQGNEFAASRSDMVVRDDQLASRAAIMGTDFGLVATIGLSSEQYVVEWRIARSNGTTLRGSFTSTSAATLARQLAEQVLGAIESRPQVPVAALPMLKDPLALELYARGTEALYQDDREQAVALLTAARARSPHLPMLQVAQAIAEFDPMNVEASLDRYRTSLDAMPVEARQARIQLEYEIGTRSWFAGAIGQAETLLQEVVAQTKPDETLHASALNSLSLVLQSQSRYDEAWEHARLAEVRFREKNNPYQLSMVLTNLGYMAEDLGRLSEARDQHQQALDIREQYHFPSLIAASQYGLARIERRRGNFEQADALLVQSLATVRELKLPFDLFDNLEELAELRMHQGRFDDAHAALQEARALAVSGADPLGIAWADEVTARLHLRTGSVNDATITMMETALLAFESSGDLENLLLGRMELAELYFATRQHERATALLLAIAPEGQLANPAMNIHWSRLKAKSFLWQGKRTEAIGVLTAAMRSARNTGVLDLEAELALELGHLSVEDADLTGARRYLAIAEAWSGEYYRTRDLAVALAQAEAHPEQPSAI
ncbi:winged helix-turn-helix domain-containing protein [Dokdonella sp.]|uniref:winged helix-turn-helix domain-containing protein n=1 Tax=Dokdonella sp. TaxID=2291710 RepID=UPI003C4348EF